MSSAILTPCCPSPPLVPHRPRCCMFCLCVFQCAGTVVGNSPSSLSLAPSFPPSFPPRSAANGAAAMDIDEADEAVSSEFDQIDKVRVHGSSLISRKQAITFPTALSAWLVSDMDVFTSCMECFRVPPHLPSTRTSSFLDIRPVERSDRVF